MTVYDTLDHQIRGVSQQQGRGGSLTLTSQRGTVERLNSAGRLGGRRTSQHSGTTHGACQRAVSARQCPGNDLFAKIERLAELHKKGILSSEEFAAKKAELLSRL